MRLNDLNKTSFYLFIHTNRNIKKLEKLIAPLNQNSNVMSILKLRKYFSKNVVSLTLFFKD